MSVKYLLYPIGYCRNEDEVTKFFQKFGDVLESQIIKDSRTGEHKGCAFVKFASMSKADEAIKLLANVHLPGSNAPMQLKWADGEVDRLGLSGIDEKLVTKLFVGSIPKNAKEENLTDIFSQYGQIKEMHLMRENDGSSKGCAFITYLLKESALLAIRTLNAQAYILDSDKPIEVRFADKKKQVSPMMIPQMGMNPMLGQMPFLMQGQSPWDYMKMFYPQMQSHQPDIKQMMQQNQMMIPSQININDMSLKNNNVKQQGPPGSNLFIFHLPNEWKESDMAAQFQQFGTIMSARIMTEKMTGRSKGYGFISFDNPQSAQNAVDNMNGFLASSMPIRKLKVQIKKGEGEDHVSTLANLKYDPY